MYDNPSKKKESNSYLKAKKEITAMTLPLPGDIQQKLFFSNAIFAMSEEERIRSKQSHSNIIAVIGAASIGKSTLLESMLQEETIKDLHDFIFYLQCEHIDYESNTNMLQFLVPTLPHQWICDRHDCLQVLKELDRSDKVLILIDGYDRLPTKPELHKIDEKSIVISIEEEATAKTFIHGILSRSLLPKAKVILTARTGCFYQLDKQFRLYPIIKILGLGNNAQEKMCQNISEKNAPKILEYIRFYPSLLAICDIPETCSAIMVVVHALLKKEKPSTEPLLIFPLTRVLTAAYELLMRSKYSVLGDKVFEHLAFLAWKKVRDRMVLEFTEDEFPDKRHLDGISMLVKELSVNVKDNVVCHQKFHVLGLEFLAALYCVLYMDEEDFQEFLDNAFQTSRDNAYRFVAIHVYALQFDEQIFWCLKKLIPTCQLSPVKTKLLEDRLNHQLKLTDNTTSTLLLLSCLAHSKSDAVLASKISLQIHNIFEVKGDVFPIDVVGLWFVLENSKKDLRLQIAQAANFIQESCKFRLEQVILKHTKVCGNI